MINKSNQIHIQNLSIGIDDKTIINHIDMQLELGKNYCILGKNGSGKSTLGMTIMGNPIYTVTEGNIYLYQEDQKIDLLKLGPDERAKLGIFLAFQNIPEIPGIKLFEFLRSIYNSRYNKTETFVTFKKIIEPILLELNIDKEFLRRDLNVGFSGGEKRKIEILQIKLLNPKYIILDEVDSGLDIDAFRSMAAMMKMLDNQTNSFIIITHYFQILDYLPIDHVYILSGGKIVQQGSIDLAKQIAIDGFGE